MKGRVVLHLLQWAPQGRLWHQVLAPTPLLRGRSNANGQRPLLAVKACISNKFVALGPRGDSKTAVGLCRSKHLVNVQGQRLENRQQAVKWNQHHKPNPSPSSWLVLPRATRWQQHRNKHNFKRRRYQHRNSNFNNRNRRNPRRSSG